MRLKTILQAKPDYLDLDGYDRLNPGFKKTVLKSVANLYKHLKGSGLTLTSDELLARAWDIAVGDLIIAFRKFVKQELERWEEQGKILRRWEEELGGVGILYEVEPNYAVPPGELLLDALEQRGISRSRAARMVGMTTYEFGLLLEGRKPLSDELAASLERTLGVPASFWLNAEKNYQRHLNSGDKIND